MTLSQELQNKLHETMTISKALAERKERTLKETIEHIANQILPFQHHIPTLPSTTLKAFPVATKENYTIWLSFKKMKDVSPYFVPKFYQSNCRPVDIEKPVNQPIRMPEIEIENFMFKFSDLAKQFESNVIVFLDSANDKMKAELAKLPTDEQLDQGRRDRNKTLYLQCKEITEMYRKASIEEKPASSKRKPSKK